MNSGASNTVNCERARQLWHDQIDGCADPGSIAEMQVHLRTCDECRRYSRQMADLIDGLNALRLASQNVPHSMVRQPVQKRSGLLRFARAAAIVFAVFGTLLYVANSYRHWPEVQSVGNRPHVIGQESGGRVPEPKAHVELTGQSEKTQLVVVRDSGNPQVHLFSIYPLAQ